VYKCMFTHGQGSQLPMYVAILEFLPNRPRTLGNSVHALNPDTLKQLVDSVVRILFVSVRSENLDPIRDGRVRLFALCHCEEGLGGADISSILGHFALMQVPNILELKPILNVTRCFDAIVAYSTWVYRVGGPGSLGVVIDRAPGGLIVTRGATLSRGW
jgi:hypothetical protein